MKSISCKMQLIIAAIFLILINCSVAFAETDPKISSDSQLVAVISLKSNLVTKQSYREVDKIVPKLKKMAHGKIIRLNCKYIGKTTNEKDVTSAYTAAGKIEKYLREKHRLNIDLWISAQLEPDKHEIPNLVFSIFVDPSSETVQQ